VLLKKLSPLFYEDNQTLIQALDFDMLLGQWMQGTVPGMPAKVRGHGIVQISLGGLTFAIPVHSNIKHRACLILHRIKNPANPQSKGMGLDYAKAMLIRDQAHISNVVFGLKPRAAFQQLKDKEAEILEQFTAYVDKYIHAKNTNDENILNSIEYRHTTLVNYHAELGL
jgi:protein AbiQ